MTALVTAAGTFVSAFAPRHARDSHRRSNAPTRPSQGAIAQHKRKRLKSKNFARYHDLRRKGEIQTV
jgi:hypothetical protein